MPAIGAIGEGLIELSVGGEQPDGAISPGGDAANVCVMAALLGADTRLAGRVGDDALGRRLIGFWRDRGMDTRWVRFDGEAATGLYVNESTEGEHRFSYWRSGSAGSRLEASDIDGDFLAGLAILVVTGVTLAVSDSSARAAEHAVARARAAGTRVACVVNHRPALGGEVGRLAALAAGADIVIASREEAETVISGIRPPELVVTDGSSDATVTCEGVQVRQPVPRVEVHNAGGAGDALAGAYLARRLAGRPPAECLAWGVAAASLSVQRDGCAMSYPTAEETRAFAEQLTAVRA